MRFHGCAEFLQLGNMTVAIPGTLLFFEAVAIKDKDHVILQVESCFDFVPGESLSIFFLNCCFKEKKQKQKTKTLFRPCRFSGHLGKPGVLRVFSIHQPRVNRHCFLIMLHISVKQHHFCFVFF